MINNVIAKVFGTANDRAVKRILPIVSQVNLLEAEVQVLSDEQLREKTDEFRARITQAVNGLSLKDDPDAFNTAEAGPLSTPSCRRRSPSSARSAAASSACVTSTSS